MKRLDIAVILKKNPQVDAGLIDQHMKKAEHAGKRVQPRTGVSISPYTGRRLVTDERMELESHAVGVHRSVHGRK
jgi:hypothetical protein